MWIGGWVLDPANSNSDNKDTHCLPYLPWWRLSVSVGHIDLCMYCSIQVSGHCSNVSCVCTVVFQVSGHCYNVSILDVVVLFGSLL